nr:alpha-2-macroglobulin receptor-associated protein-like [Cherax quadricarinatus]
MSHCFTMVCPGPRILVYTIIMVTMGAHTLANKYSEAANTKVHFERNPFRMAKLNLLWDKALKVTIIQRAEEGLLRWFEHVERMDWDKMMKRVHKSGVEGRRDSSHPKSSIMVRYNLSDDLRDNKTSSKEPYLNEVTDQKILKAVFKDKKLNKLWVKAESSGFTEPELKALKEEFQHHQDKIDDYYALINSASVKMESEQNNLENDIKRFDTLQDLESSAKSAHHPTNALREKHRELKEGYDRLHKVASTGPDSKEFVEPKVAGLWKLAIRGDFTQEELESLHTELKHYEHRLLKVRHLTGQMNVLQERAGDDIEKFQSTEGQRVLQERLAKQQRKVEKLHEDLEMRILQRHLEL